MVDEQVGEQVDEQVDEQVGEQVEEQVGEQIKEQVLHCSRDTGRVHFQVDLNKYIIKKNIYLIF